MSFCKRCRKRLIKPNSIVVGYGRVCLLKEQNNIPFSRRAKVITIKPLSTFKLSEWF
jgi:hypothetical protein